MYACEMKVVKTQKVMPKKTEYEKKNGTIKLKRIYIAKC